jgi:hypothetical protein
MASKQLDADGVHETCEHCGQERPHEVSIELKTESSKEENAEFSREPYRVAECTVCSTTNRTRMNNA